MMRLVIDAFLTILFVFAALKLEWPAYLLVVLLYVLAMNVHLISWGAKLRLSRRVEWVAGGFVFAALVFSYAFYVTIPETLGGSPETAPSPFYSAFFTPDRLRVYWAFLVGSALAAACFAVLLGATALAAGFALYHTSPQYRGHEGEAALSGLNLALGLDNGYWIIDNGNMQQLTEPKGLIARFGGPGRLMVRLGNAVVLEIGGRPTRVVGSGLTFLQPYERVSMIVPLYGRGETITVTEIETKDRAVIDLFEFTAFHRVDPGSREHQIHDGPMVYNRHVILDKIWAPDGADWVGLVRSVGHASARDLIGQLKLEEMIPMADARRTEFKLALKNSINRVTEKLGVQVTTVEIGRIKLPEPTKQQMLDNWNADWESRAQLKRAETANSIHISEAAARLQTITAVAQGLRTTLGTGATPRDLITLRYIEYLEQRAAGAQVGSENEIDTLMQLQALGTLNEL